MERVEHMSQIFKTTAQRQAEQRAEILRKREEDALRKQQIRQKKKEFVVWSFGAVLVNALVAGGLFIIFMTLEV